MTARGSKIDYVTLSPTQIARIVQLRDEEGLIWRDLATRFGCSESPVRRAYRAAKARLAGEVDETEKPMLSYPLNSRRDAR